MMKQCKPSIEVMVVLYNSNNDFKNYVDKYCVKHNIDIPQEAMEHALIRDAYDYYSGKL